MPDYQDKINWLKVNESGLLHGHFSEIRSDYWQYINKPQEYQQKVDTISDLFSLKGRQRLKGDNCPVYVVVK